MNPLIDLVHIDRSHSINGTAYHTDQILLLVVGFEMISNIGVLLIYPFFCYVVIKSNTISVSACFYFMVFVEICGFMGFLHIFQKNIKLKRRLAKENEIYSVAHKFQVQENVEVLRFMLRMVKVWFLFVTLSFMSYGFFVFGPNGLELWRNVSYCIFELLTALHFSTFYYLSITGNAHIHKQFCSLFPCLCRPNTVEPADLQREQTTESARYFADLRRHWN